MRDETSTTWFFNTWKTQVPARHRLAVPRHRRPSYALELAVYTVTVLFGAAAVVTGLLG